MVAPVEKDSKEATFTALAANFGFNDEVTNLFLKGPMENLEDFRYYFADEEGIDAFVAEALEPAATTSLKPEENRVGALETEEAQHRQRWIQRSRVRRA